MNNQSLASRIRSFLSILIISCSAFCILSCSSGGGNSLPTVSISDASVAEGVTGTTNLVFTLTLSSAAGSNATVTYTTSDGTAIDVEDYTASTDTVTFTAGSTSATITILVKSDDVYEGNETFTVTLSNPTNLTLGTSTATGSITNDDSVSFNGFFTGSASVNSGTTLSDLVGLAYDNRLMLFSRTGASNVLYDITTITNTSGNDYSGTLETYFGPAGAQTKANSSVDLTISGGQITGTLNGSGLGNGSFTIMFDLANNTGATLARVEAPNPNLWRGRIYGVDDDTARFSVDVLGEYIGINDNTPACGYIDNLIIPVSQLNIYLLAHDVIEAVSCGYISTGHTGVASVITTTTTDDTLVYAFANGTYGLFAVMDHP